MAQAGPRRNLVLWVSAVSAVVSLIQGSVYAVQGHPAAMASLVSAAWFFATAGIAIWRWRVGAWALQVGGVGALIWAAACEGGLYGEGLLYVAFPTWATAYMLDRRASVLVALLSAMGVAGLALGHLQGAIESGDDLLARVVAPLGAIVVGFVIGWAGERRWRGAEREVAQGAARSRAMLDAMPDAVLLVSRTGMVVDARVPREAALAGLGEFAGRPLTAVFGPADAKQLVAAVRTAGAPASVESVYVVAHLGEAPVHLEARLSVHPSNDVIVVLRDVSTSRRASQARESFVAMVSHELRTPLTSIHGSLNLLQDGNLSGDPGRAARIIDVAYRNTVRLRRIIDDLIDVERMQSGELALHLVPLDLAKLLESTAEANVGYADLHQVTLVTQPLARPTTVRVDEDRFHQVLANLVSNAIKYSPRHGTVTLRARHADALRVRVEVTDEGGGIPETFQDKVFDSFSQADSATTRRVGGAGLGLSIAKRLVEGMGGQIDFVTAPGQGTTFWFELPVFDSLDDVGP